MNVKPPPPADVAVVIAAYNAADTISIAVRSALAEPEVTEVWVIDDASHDGTGGRAIACDDGSGRLRVLRQSKNGGPSAARNLALAATQASWICVLDADDRFAPGRIGRLLAAPVQADLIADGVTKVADLGADLGPWDQAQGSWRQVGLAEFIEGNVSRRGRHREELGFIKPLMSIGFLRRHRISYAAHLRLGEDFLLYAKALAYGGALALGPPQGYLALTRPDSLSARHSIADLQALRDCTPALEGVRTLSEAERRAVRRHWRSVDDRLQWRRLIEAVKTRDFRSAAATFHDPRASLHLAGKLLEQARLRATARFSGAAASQAREGSPTTTRNA
jgi:succinoglycan biosynthesis protein ExoU